MIEVLLSLVLVSVLALLVRSFLPSYLGQKGKNLADKEDIAAITRAVESVRNEYSMLVEQLKGTNQLRMAAIERRLQAHQEAFALWQKLRACVHSEAVHSVSVECSQWWSNNCLFMEPEARQAFLKAYLYSTNHTLLKEQFRGTKNVKPVTDSWSVIDGAGDVILRTVQLPPLTGEERAALEKEVVDKAQ